MAHIVSPESPAWCVTLAKVPSPWFRYSTSPPKQVTRRSGHPSLFGSPTTADSVKHRLLIQGRDAQGQPSMTIGSYNLDQGDTVQDVMRAFQVGLVMGALHDDEVMALLERYPPHSS